MDSLDAQCLIFDTLDNGDAVPPPNWLHAQGTLSWRFGAGGNTYTWTEDQVGEMAREWRSSNKQVPERIADLVASHRRFLEIVASSEDMSEPTSVAHDLDRNEVVAQWQERKLAVVIGPD